MPFSTSILPVPMGLRTADCVLQPLRASDVERDYEAVMASQEPLRHRTGGRWPRADFTLAENLTDLEEHEADFAAHRGFTYTVLDPSATRCLGCVYAYPLDTDAEDTAEAAVWFWVRPECVAAGIDQRLLAALIPWLRDDFAFTRVLFRASANDAQQQALMHEAGLQERERRLWGSIETVLFE